MDELEHVPEIIQQSETPVQPQLNTKKRKQVETKKPKKKSKKPKKPELVRRYLANFGT